MSPGDATIEAFTREATSEKGYTEAPAGTNKTKFAAEVGHANGQPWCATFIVAMAKRTGLRLASSSAYTPSMAQAYIDAKRWYSSQYAQRGDIVFFDFPDAKKRIQHVGILLSIDRAKSTVTCIEGNTASGTSGSQDNGGGVYIRTRPIANNVVGFGRPFFDQPATKETFMALTDAEQKELLDSVRELKNQAVQGGEPRIAATFDQVKAVRTLLEELKTSVEAEDVDGGSGQISPATIDRIADAVVAEIAS